MRIAAFKSWQPFAQASQNAVTPAGYTNTFTMPTVTSASRISPATMLVVVPTLCDDTTGCIVFNIGNYAPTYLIGPETDYCRLLA